MHYILCVWRNVVYIMKNLLHARRFNTSFTVECGYVCFNTAFTVKCGYVCEFPCEIRYYHKGSYCRQ